MVSTALASAIREEASIIFQDTCERSIKEVLQSERFLALSEKVKREIPNLTDADIMRHLIISYAKKLRSE